MIKTPTPDSPVLVSADDLNAPYVEMDSSESEHDNKQVIVLENHFTQV